MHNLGELANVRKQNLHDNSAYLQFMWKADVVESWIADKESYVRSEDCGKDLSSVQTLLTKQVQWLSKKIGDLINLPYKPGISN